MKGVGIGDLSLASPMESEPFWKGKASPYKEERYQSIA